MPRLVVGHKPLACLDHVPNPAGIENRRIRHNRTGTTVPIPPAEHAQQAHLIAVLGQHLNKALYHTCLLTSEKQLALPTLFDAVTGSNDDEFDSTSAPETP